jgi:glycosyltransferase involved in cell wall biosynthesis
VSAPRALFVTHNFPRRAGDAAGAFLLDLARALADDGVRVRVIAPHAAGLAPHDTVAGIPVTRVRYASDARETLAYTGTMAEQALGSATGALTLLALLRALRRATREALDAGDMDVVHAHWWFPAALAVAPVVHRARVAFVSTSHGSDVRLARGGVARRLARHALRHADAVTTVSRWLGEALQPCAPVPVSIAPMPADVTRFTADARTARDPRRLLFVGRLNAQKQPLLLVEALAQLPGNVTLDLVGEGPLRDALTARIAALGLGSRVRLLGQVARDALPALMRGAGIVAVPSRDEGFGLVAAEALLCGTPVVASDEGGLRDIVRDGVTGLAVREPTAEAWSRALGQLVDAPAQGAALAAAGREAMLALVAPAAVAARHRAIYADAIERRRSGRG